MDSVDARFAQQKFPDEWATKPFPVEVQEAAKAEIAADTLEDAKLRKGGMTDEDLADYQQVRREERKSGKESKTAAAAKAKADAAGQQNADTSGDGKKS
jgi:hypothetical protein